MPSLSLKYPLYQFPCKFIFCFFFFSHLERAAYSDPWLKETVKIPVLISSKWTQHHTEVVFLSYSVLHWGFNHLVLWYSAVIAPFQCACLWELLYQTARYLVQSFEGLWNSQCDIRAHLINAFEFNLAMLRMISDSTPQPTAFSCVGSISCLKLFSIAMATLTLQQPLTRLHRNAFIFQAGCALLSRSGAFSLMKHTSNPNSF